MIAAAQTGKGGPWWINVLTASASWSKAPWEWAGGDPITWFLRWRAWQVQLDKKYRPDPES